MSRYGSGASISRIERCEMDANSSNQYPQTVEKPKRWRWQFSLRSLLILVGVLCLFLGITRVHLWIPGLKAFSLFLLLFQNWLFCRFLVRDRAVAPGTVARALAIFG